WVRHEFATSPRSRTTWSIERSARQRLMASPQWPAPTITAVVFGTATPRVRGSGHVDRDVGWVGDDVVDRGTLLRLRDQRPDLLGRGVGIDLVAHGHAAEAVADVRVGAEDPVQVHFRRE